MSKLKVPVVCVIIGEGCSGGALGIGVGDRVLMMQYSYYATISPEGCATILFRSVDRKADAAEMMGITADKLLELGVVDGIVPEPLGGAHRDHKQAAQNLKQHIKDNLQMLAQLPIESLVEKRYEKIMALGNA
jgi:acetyl-CoA carboxylase carboxyl transferase subunit alpha